MSLDCVEMGAVENALENAQRHKSRVYIFVDIPSDFCHLEPSEAGKRVTMHLEDVVGCGYHVRECCVVVSSVWWSPTAFHSA